MAEDPEVEARVFDIAADEAAGGLDISLMLDGQVFECKPLLTGATLRVLRDTRLGSNLAFIEACLVPEALERWRPLADDLSTKQINAVSGWLLEQYLGMAEGKS